MLSSSWGGLALKQSSLSQSLGSQHSSARSFLSESPNLVKVEGRLVNKYQWTAGRCENLESPFNTVEVLDRYRADSW